MLSKLRIKRYKSLYDAEIGLEPLTIFIGPNGSGKSNICEALAVWSYFIRSFVEDNASYKIVSLFSDATTKISSNSQSLAAKFWQSKLDYLVFEATAVKSYSKDEILEDILEIAFKIDFLNSKAYVGEVLIRSSDDYTSNLKKYLLSYNFHISSVYNSLKTVKIYDFSPADISLMRINASNGIERSGRGIAYSLVDILHANRQSFDELEERLTQLVPNIARISLPRNGQDFELVLIDRYSDHHIPASDISDGTLRILAFLVALYQENTPSVICFEEIENGVHPWLLHKMIELLKIVSSEGINGKPVQILITTHSPLILNYVEPHQVRAVELDSEGKTQVHALPTESVRFQKSLEAYDGELGELWLTNVFGGNPV